ncbi:dnaJ homolog subfamily C member 28 isoform X2 [Leguminivora glycinivorella]|uniref:dnaJ homolog subfamily C member 28 isoform X2 n=1 Tax=Leguminivora glycinivorella TaxID=1035111 RepID=UPI00200EC7F4|nr:dnaJ homolog subfamily C member 28 isoform X2 [Leguminivora glycinivorella]
MFKCIIFSERVGPITYKLGSTQNRTLTIVTDTQIEECYNILKIPVNSKQDLVRAAFLDLAKIYHPDSGSPQACIEKFVDIENAFRILTKHNTGKSSQEDVEQIVHDIRHTAPQHRQYLSFDGVGYGTPFQRQKQWAQARAQRAASNVMEHRVSKAVASENTLMKKGQGYGQKHDIKTKYGFDRLVEDLIQESMSKGEFEKLSGIGKPLKDQNTNPYVDFTTHKLNEVLINNGFVPEWITMNKEIDHDIEALKDEIRRDRSFLGPYPLSEHDQPKWDRICEANRELAKSINTKINTYNLIVPLINKQKFHVDFDKICEDVLVSGIHSVKQESKVKEKPVTVAASSDYDFIGVFFKAVGELFSFKSKKNLDS